MWAQLATTGRIGDRRGSPYAERYRPAPRGGVKIKPPRRGYRRPRGRKGRRGGWGSIDAPQATDISRGRKQSIAAAVSRRCSPVPPSTNKSLGPTQQRTRRARFRHTVGAGSRPILRLGAESDEHRHRSPIWVKIWVLRRADGRGSPLPSAILAGFPGFFLGGPRRTRTYNPKPAKESRHYKHLLRGLVVKFVVTNERRPDSDTVQPPNLSGFPGFFRVSRVGLEPTTR